MDSMRTEFRKAICSRWFVVPLCVMLVIAVISAIGGFVSDSKSSSYYQFLSTKWLDPSTSSCFKYSIVCDFTQPSTDLFFLLLPLFCTIPFSWTLLNELNSGFISNVAIRVRASVYLRNKYFVAFVVGGCIALIPIVVNSALCACLLPGRVPDVTSSIYFAVFDGNLFSWLFYNCPVAYLAAYAVLNFIFCGVWSAFVMSLSFLIRRPFLLLAVPYGTLIVFKAVFSSLPSEYINFELSPFVFLRGCALSSQQSGWFILSFVAVLLLFITATILFIGKRGFHE